MSTLRLFRLVLGYVVMTTAAVLTGWSFVLPAAASLVAVQHIRRSGRSRWWPGVLTTTVLTAATQAAVQLGWAPTVVDPTTSLVAAVLVLLPCLNIIGGVGVSVAAYDAAARARAQAESRLAILFENFTDVVSVVDVDSRIVSINPAITSAMGHPQDDLVGSPLLDLVDADHRTDVAERLAGVVEAGPASRANFDVLMRHASGERRWYEWDVLNMVDDPGVSGLLVIQRDVTERLLHSEALAQAAARDELTGLANRGELLRRLAAVLSQATPGAGVAVLFIDLDRFKEVNDTYGHAAGDQVLVTVARRLQGGLRAHDHLARLGGDEFCAILTEVREPGEVDAVVARLEAGAEEPIRIPGGLVAVGASIGAALTTDPDHSPEALFSAADAAMYEVKRARR